MSVLFKSAGSPRFVFFDIENRDRKVFNSSHVSFILKILAFQSYLIYY